MGRRTIRPLGGKQQPVAPMNAEQARQLAENYVAGNPNLKVGQITEKGDHGAFAATIVTQDGSLVEKLLINKKTA